MTTTTMVASTAESSWIHTSRASDTTKLLLAQEAATLLRIPPNRIYELAKRSLIPCVRIGRLVRFPEHLLLAWIEAGGTCDDSGGITPRHISAVVDSRRATR